MQQTIVGSGFHKKSIEVNKQLEFSDNLTETEKADEKLKDKRIDLEEKNKEAELIQ